MSVIAVLGLLVDVVPKIIAAGKNITDVWNAAHEAISGAQPDGTIDAAAMQKVRDLVKAQLTELDSYAAEAKKGLENA
jgi:hypothetical protein